MPILETTYNIFLGSPSDVQIDRDSVDEVIDELNQSFGHQNGIVLKLKRWETHAAPGVDTDNQQELIKRDIGEYDLFIGLLATRFGTKTNRSESGTEDEFNDAYNKFLSDPTSIQIMVYFKRTKVDPSKIDIEQLSKVQAFRERLGDEQNVLYWEYEETAQLQKFLRIHIPKRILELHINNSQANIPEKKPKSSIEVEQYEKEELGILDYQELIEDKFALSTQALERMTEATTWIGDEITKKAEEITALTTSDKQPSRKALQGLFKRTASIMENYADRLDPELPIFADNFESAIDAYSNLVNIYKSDLSIKEHQIEDSFNSLSSLVESVDNSIDGMTGFFNSIDSLPRMSKDINRSKRKVAQVLSNLLNKLQVSRSIAVELLRRIRN